MTEWLPVGLIYWKSMIMMVPSWIRLSFERRLKLIEKVSPEYWDKMCHSKCTSNSINICHKLGNELIELKKWQFGVTLSTSKQKFKAITCGGYSKELSYLILESATIGDTLSDTCVSSLLDLFRQWRLSDDRRLVTDASMIVAEFVANSHRLANDMSHWYAPLMLRHW